MKQEIQVRLSAVPYKKILSVFWVFFKHTVTVSVCWEEEMYVLGLGTYLVTLHVVAALFIIFPNIEGEELENWGLRRTGAGDVEYVNRLRRRGIPITYSWTIGLSRKIMVNHHSSSSLGFRPGSISYYTIQIHPP